MSESASPTSSDDFFTTRLGFAQTYRRAFTIVGRHWGTFLCLTACLIAPLLIILITASILMGPVNADTGEMDHYGPFVSALAIEWVLYFIFEVFCRASMSRAVAESYVGNSPSGLACMKKTMSRLPALLCFTVLWSLVVFLSILLPVIFIHLAVANTNSTFWLIMAIVISIICITWLIFFSVALVCAVPALVVETKLSAIAAMKRSAFELVLGHFWYTFCTMFWIIALTYVVIVVLGPLGHVANAFLIPFNAILSTVVYLNLRVPKESLSRGALAKDLGMEPPIESSTSEDSEPVVVEGDII